MKLLGKVALVTGASSGIGKDTVKDLISNGATVYAAARRVELMGDLESIGAVAIKMDVTDETSMVEGVGAIIEKEGKIDILVNNAGYGSYGAIEDVSIEEGRRQFDVNIFGLARLTQLVLPKMRENRWGKIVNISSIGGKIYSGFGGWYHATKHAVEGLSDCLRLELSEFGIDVIIIEPGLIKTDWGLIASENLRKTSGSGAYATRANATSDGMKKMYTNNTGSNPSIISKMILKAVLAKKPRTRYSAGTLSGISLFARKVLSDRMFDRIVTKIV